ncbi:MAG: oxidoreductase [Candidatus Aminicenantes bacterium RBG_16_63_16]|nr:MAG: oxidoreductase [Candidatus Aminicenantes bacterium RBG_16_63_16]
MKKAHNIALLGAGLIGTFYTMTVHGRRSRDRIKTICAVTEAEAEAFAKKYGIPNWTADMKKAVSDPAIDLVIVGVPNYLHKKAITLAAKAGKAVLCTKPLGRSAREALEIIQAVEKAGVFAGYLEDLVYTPKTLKSIASVKGGAVGKVLWVRSRETHSGPHSAWFWDKKLAGGGAIVDLACHCIEIIRSFVGKDVRPVEVMCTADTLVHPIAAEDSAIGLIRFEDRAIGQFEVSWTFRGGMDLRDEVAGTEGTIWLNHFLRTGFEMFTAAGSGGYVAEKAETEKGWLFPVGDEVHELGYVNMFGDMFDALDEGREPVETFLDGYIVNAVMDACYRSAKTRRWEPVRLESWYPGKAKQAALAVKKPRRERYSVIKEERMPDGSLKQIVQDWKTGHVIQRTKGA